MKNTKLFLAVVVLSLAGVACSHNQEKSWDDFVKQPGAKKVEKKLDDKKQAPEA
ncbi:hypothetical protein [Pseudobacteriovorax antillogorgiicola]|uniref:Lipoprotein n=1 Tax=Pseudobacteriovorax antillogorgiicola TaxID=1513793 RepID=A0A1Y6BIV8_9BACT|nr:hypothetical protein [Pseudobacteriovorax antillogorgiicola]TCS56399.1 hypothetical protein EDD56_104221 [Pseudobacteriovorax antillogorgiicola]SMF06113.1 hypothetical protein SAMN06296036_104112 [Pseudobacteriovorax antillogorgiicola]